jgi:hypothetical protein
LAQIKNNLIMCTRDKVAYLQERDLHMNITLAVEEQTARRAREAAQKMGKSLNQAIRDYLEQIGGSLRREQEWAQYEARCLESSATLEGWRFNRDEANER